MPNPAGDIEINGLPYMLAREPTPPGRRLWRVFNISTQTTRRTELDAKYGVAAPEIQYPFSWENWSSGFGDEEVVRDGGAGYTNQLDASIPGQLALFSILQTAFTPVAAPSDGEPYYGVQFEYQSNWYQFWGRRGYKLTSTDVSSDLNPIGTYSFFNDGVVFGTYAYLATYGSGYVQQAFYQMNTGGTLTQATTSLPATHFGVVTDKLWRAYVGTATTGSAEQMWVVASCPAGADPTAYGNWSTGYAVGESSAPITKIIEHNGATVVAKADGLYMYDSNRNLFKNILKAARFTPNRDNGSATLSWQGQTILYNAQQALYAIGFDANGQPVVRDVTPGLGRKNNIGGKHIRGFIQGLAEQGSLLWAVNGPTTASGALLKGEWQGLDQAEPILWHLMVDGIPGVSGYVWNIAVNALSGNDRLYLIHRSSAPNTAHYYYRLYRPGENPLQLSSFPFETAADGNQAIFLPRHNANAPTTFKSFRRFYIEGNTQASGSIRADWRVDGTGSYSLLGTFGPGEGRTKLMSFPTGALGYGIEVVVRFYSSSGSASPYVTKLIGLATARPESIRGYEAYLRLGSELRLPGGGYDPRDANQISTDIYNLRATGPVQLVTPLGDSRNVLILNNIEEQEVAQYNVDWPEMVAKITMIDWS